MTILGKHTVSELKDLVDSHQLLIDNLTTKRRSLNWNNAESAAWDMDWVRFLGRWSGAASNAKKVIAEATVANPFVGPTLIPAEATYQQVLQALQVTPGRWQTGDFQDMVIRLDNAGGKLDDSVVKKFQAVAVESLDLDEEGFKKDDALIKAGEGVRDAAIKAMPWGKIALGGAGAIGTLAILHKLKLL